MKKTKPKPPTPGLDHELLKVDTDVHSLARNIFELAHSKAKPEELTRQYWWRYLRHYSFKDKTKTNGGCLEWIPPTGLDVLNEQRRPEEFAAFRYEAIRRSFCPDQPIWPELEYSNRKMLIAALIGKEEIPCMFVGEDANALDRFCLQLPSGIAWDLRASDRTLADAFLTFVRDERIKTGIQPIKMSHEKRCKPQDYTRLELLDDDVLVKATSAKKGPGRPPKNASRSPIAPSPDSILRYKKLRIEAQQWDDELLKRVEEWPFFSGF